MNRKIFIAGFLVMISILLIVLKGPSFGIDFSGGYSIKLQLEKPVTQEQMNQIISILENRLNSYGLSDIRIKPYGNQYISIEMSENNKSKVEKLISVLKKQGNLEGIIRDQNGKGVIIFNGAQLVSIEKPVMTGAGNGYVFSIPIVITSDAAERFANLSNPNNIYGDKIYLFLDRPKNAIIYVPYDDYNKYNEIIKSKFGFDISLFKQIANIDITTNIKSLENISNKTVILPSNLKNETKTIEKLKKNNNKIIFIKYDDDYIIKATGIKSALTIAPSLRGVKAVKAEITNSGRTLEEAKKNAEETYIILKSGKLPVKFDENNVIISSISPTLGKMYVLFSMLILVLAVILVSILIYSKYREIKITFLIVLTTVCEIIIIFGLASLISWQLDIPSIAGIIMAIGTGVDQQIIIIDEYLKRKKSKGSMKIIFTSVFTTISAMFPLLFISIGTVRGFALTTILGSLIGVLITRPAFAELIKKVL